MNIKTFKLEDLTEFDGNYNRHPETQIEHLKRSLNDFEQIKNVVVWKDKVVCGNGLVAAARALQWDEIQAVDVSHLTKKQAKALLIADNKTAEMAEPDNELLLELLNDFDNPLEEVPGITVDFLAGLDNVFDDFDSPINEENQIEVDEQPENNSKKIPVYFLLTREEYNLFKQIKKKHNISSDIDFFKKAMEVLI
jgi:hypothetical protein